jgi:hypothetical protein
MGEKPEEKAHRWSFPREILPRGKMRRIFRQTHIIFLNLITINQPRHLSRCHQSIYLGKFHHDLTVLLSPGIMVFIWGTIPKWPHYSG